MLLVKNLEPGHVSWIPYAHMEAADNDPVLPHHYGHYLRGSLRDGGFAVNEVPNAQEVWLLRVKQRNLHVQLRDLNAVYNQLQRMMEDLDKATKYLLSNLVNPRPTP